MVSSGGADAVAGSVVVAVISEATPPLGLAGLTLVPAGGAVGVDGMSVDLS